MLKIKLKLLIVIVIDIKFYRCNKNNVNFLSIEILR